MIYRVTHCTAVVAIALLFAPLTMAAKWKPNYDESKVPEYTLPDPLVMQDGTPVTDADT